MQHLESRRNDTINALRHQVDKEKLNEELQILKLEGDKRKEDYDKLEAHCKR